MYEFSREYIIISWKSLKNWNMSAIFAKLKMVLNCWIGKHWNNVFLDQLVNIQFLA